MCRRRMRGLKGCVENGFGGSISRESMTLGDTGLWAPLCIGPPLSPTIDKLRALPDAAHNQPAHLTPNHHNLHATARPIRPPRPQLGLSSEWLYAPLSDLMQSGAQKPARETRPFPRSSTILAASC